MTIKAVRDIYFADGDRQLVISGRSNDKALNVNWARGVFGVKFGLGVTLGMAIARTGRLSPAMLGAIGSGVIAILFLESQHAAKQQLEVATAHRNAIDAVTTMPGDSLEKRQLYHLTFVREIERQILSLSNLPYPTSLLGQLGILNLSFGTVATFNIIALHRAVTILKSSFSITQGLTLVSSLAALTWSGYIRWHFPPGNFAKRCSSPIP